MANPHPKRAKTPDPVVAPRMDQETLSRALEEMMRKLIDAHERLLIAVERHCAALTRADAQDLREAIELETSALMEIADLERARATLMGDSGPRTISELAGTLPDPVRDRVIELATRLRELIQRLRSRQAVVRAATKSLLSHTHGLMAQVGAALSHAGTYGRAGRVQSTTPACAALDLST